VRVGETPTSTAAETAVLRARLPSVPPTDDNSSSPTFARGQQENALMPATGEIIRLMNYVDDIAATLRRITVSLPTLTDEERKQLADYMRKSDPNFVKVLEGIERTKHA
jgi:hypothetical protein